MSRSARFAALLALAAGLALGVAFTVSVVSTQPERLFPAPLLWIAAWSLAPALAVIGTRSASRMVALGLTMVAFLVEASSFMSMGGGFVYLIVVAPLLLLSLALIARGERDFASRALG